MYQVKFRGGSLKENNREYKFHAFILTADQQEYIFYEALQKGFVTRGQRKDGANRDEYQMQFPIVKVLTAQSGFGIHKAYYNFFVKLNPESKLLTIRSFGHDERRSSNRLKNLVFQCRGRFMTHDEILKAYPDDSKTIMFYSKQARLTKAELQSLASLDQAEDEPGLKQKTVRFIR